MNSKERLLIQNLEITHRLQLQLPCQKHYCERVNEQHSDISIQLTQPVVFCDVMPYNQKTLKTEATDSSEALVSTRLHGVTPGIP